MKPKFEPTGKLINGVGCCSKCQKRKPLAEVREIETGKTEWRCGECVRKLKKGGCDIGRDIAHELAKLNLEKMRNDLEKSK